MIVKREYNFRVGEVIPMSIEVMGGGGVGHLMDMDTLMVILGDILVNFNKVNNCSKLFSFIHFKKE